MIILVALLCILLILLVNTRAIYGKIIDENQLDLYFETHLSSLKLNSINTSIMSADTRFVAKLPVTLYAKWYVDGVGVIPLWSKWSKVLDSKHKQLLTKE